MKKDLLIYLINVVASICVVAIIISTATGYTALLGEISYGVATVFSPKFDIEKISKNNDTKTDKTDNTNNTVAISASRRIDGIKDKDSELYSDITKTPDDIAKLMDDAKKTIKTEKVKGKTSEADYFGGGTLISFDRLEIQSKIPSSFYKPDIDALLKQKADLTIQDISKPTILVYHSHTTESYTLLDAGYYTESLDLRSKDNDKNMVRVGDELVKYLELQGFKVIHDTDVHDENYTGAYDSSRKSVEKYLEEYPSIEITIDVHRDDITYDNKTKVKPTAKINGKKAARMMIIAGAEYGRVEKFPNWEYNLRFDLAIQNKVEEMYSGLMRPILFAERKYNMFETKNSFLLEVGTDGNTLDEACYSARLFATALGELLKEDYVKNR